MWALEQGSNPPQTKHSCILLLGCRDVISEACISDNNKVSYLTEQLAHQANTPRALNKLPKKKKKPPWIEMKLHRACCSGCCCALKLDCRTDNATRGQEIDAISCLSLTGLDTGNWTEFNALSKTMWSHQGRRWKIIYSPNSTNTWFLSTSRSNLQVLAEALSLGVALAWGAGGPDKTCHHPAGAVLHILMSWSAHDLFILKQWQSQRALSSSWGLRVPHWKTIAEDRWSGDMQDVLVFNRRCATCGAWI